MRPLHLIGLGLLWLLLGPVENGVYDPIPDWVGWLFIMWGTRRIGGQYANGLMTLAIIAFVASIPTWFAAVDQWMHDTDPAIEWAVSLPQLGYCVLLCHALMRLAKVNDGVRPDRSAVGWLGVLRVALVLAGVLPILAIGGGIDSLNTPAVTIAGISLLVLMFTLFVYGFRVWAPQPPSREDTSPN